MLQEFKKFALRGNVIDLAVGVIIGGAFGSLVSSIVEDIILPPIGLLLGNVNFSDLFISLSGEKFATLAEAQAAGAPTINYGLFFNNVINFVILTFVIFWMVRVINRLTQAEAEAAPTTHECPHCLSQIPLKASRCPACTSEVEPAA